MLKTQEFYLLVIVFTLLLTNCICLVFVCVRFVQN
jgi:hypothetical protein